MASWKLPKDPGKDHYASAMLSRIRTFDKPISMKLAVTTQMAMNLHTVKGNRYAQAHTTDQLRQYRDVVAKHFPGLHKEIQGFEGEFKKYEKYLKGLKRKPDKKVVKHLKTLRAAMAELTQHIKEIEAHKQR